MVPAAALGLAATIVIACLVVVQSIALLATMLPG